jgi:hypothetical protein
MLPKAAWLPARENGVDCTAVPYTLAFGAPNAAKSVTTLRGGDDAKPDSGDLDSDPRGGSDGT